MTLEKLYDFFDSYDRVKKSIENILGETKSLHRFKYSGSGTIKIFYFDYENDSMSALQSIEIKMSDLAGKC